jgi:hypothetical protein
MKKTLLSLALIVAVCSLLMPWLVKTPSPMEQPGAAQTAQPIVVPAEPTVTPCTH